MTVLDTVQKTVVHLEESIESRLESANLTDLIRLYKGVHFIEKSIEGMKNLLKGTIKAQLEIAGIQSYRCVHGVALITSPTTMELDREAWEKALEEDEHLKRIEDAFHEVENIRERAQKPFLREREGWVLIR